MRTTTSSGQFLRLSPSRAALCALQSSLARLFTLPLTTPPFHHPFQLICARVDRDQLSTTIASISAAFKPIAAVSGDGKLTRILAPAVEALCARFGWDITSDVLWARPESVSPVPGADGDQHPAPACEHITAMLRGLVVSILLKAKHAGAVAEACRRFDAFVDDDGFKYDEEGCGDEGKSGDAAAAAASASTCKAAKAARLLSPDVRDAVYAVAARTEGAAGLARLLRIVQESPLAEEQERGAVAMASVANQPEISSVLELVARTFGASKAGPAVIRKQTLPSW